MMKSLTSCILVIVIAIICVSSMLFFESCRYDEGPYPVHDAKIDSRNLFALSNPYHYLYVISNERLISFRLEDGILTPTNDMFDAAQSTAVYTSDTVLVMSGNSYYNGGTAYEVYQGGAIQMVDMFDIKACDQVAIKGKYIFQSKQVGSDCRPNGDNSLTVLNLDSDLSPDTVLSVASPYGLSIDNDLLFLCQGSNGLSVYDVHDPSNISLIKYYSNIPGEYPYASDGLLVITNNDAIKQYDYSDLNDIKLLSSIP